MAPAVGGTGFFSRLAAAVARQFLEALIAVSTPAARITIRANIPKGRSFLLGWPGCTSYSATLRCYASDIPLRPKFSHSQLGFHSEVPEKDHGIGARRSRCVHSSSCSVHRMDCANHRNHDQHQHGHDIDTQSPEQHLHSNREISAAQTRFLLGAAPRSGSSSDSTPRGSSRSGFAAISGTESARRGFPANLLSLSFGFIRITLGRLRSKFERTLSIPVQS